MAAAARTEAGTSLHFRFQARPPPRRLPGCQGAGAGCRKSAPRRTSRRARSGAASEKRLFGIRPRAPPPPPGTAARREARASSPKCFPASPHLSPRRSALLLFCFLCHSRLISGRLSLGAADSACRAGRVLTGREPGRQGDLRVAEPVRPSPGRVVWWGCGENEHDLSQCY